MARHPIPQVINNQLTPLDATGGSLPAIQVGSADWHAWLNNTATRSFAYHSAYGILTARRERRHGTWYWYAYRTRQGRLHKAYLGKSEELTLAKLKDVATMMSVGTETYTQESDTTRPVPLPATTQFSPIASTQPAHLLMTKFYVPPTRPRMVARPRLMEQLHAGMRSKLTLLVAPAGYGKTTLLSAWHADPNRPAWPFAWVSLDSSDNDPARFWSVPYFWQNRKATSAFSLMKAHQWLPYCDRLSRTTWRRATSRACWKQQVSTSQKIPIALPRPPVRS